MPAKKPSVDPIQDLLKDVEKKFNLTVGNMAEIAQGVVAYSTGNIAMDYAIGVGGLPVGRSVELYGPPSCGKTTVALQTAAALQALIKAGGGTLTGPDGTKIKVEENDRILYMDHEQAMDKEYADALGLDTEHKSFMFSQPDTLEDSVNFAIAAIRTGRIRLVIFDSVASMIPSAKAEAEIGKSLPAVQAKLMKDFTSVFNSTLYNNNCTAIFINHLMEKMDMGPKRPGMPTATTTPGGVALKFFASVRIEFQPIKKNRGPVWDPVMNEEVERVVSTDVKAKVTKNKVSPPFREAICRVRFGRGFDNFWTAMQILLANKKVMYGEGRFKFHRVEEFGLAPEWMPRMSTGTQPPAIHGEKRLMTEADLHPEWREAVINFARSVVEENVKALENVVPVGHDDPEQEELEDIIESESGSDQGNRVKI